MPKPGRPCSLCPTSRMKRHVRHLHELEAGASFTFHGDDQPHQLVRIGRASCLIRGTSTKHRVAFTDADGNERRFTARQAGVRYCSPGAEVVPTTGSTP